MPFDRQSVWGLLFLFWTALAVRSGETYLVECLTRRADPLLFWLLVATSIGLSVYLVVADLGRWGAT